MTTLELTNNWIEQTVEITFNHNMNSVDVHLWNSQNERVITAKNQDADVFLSFFDYNQHQCDDIKTIKDYLTKIL